MKILMVVSVPFFHTQGTAFSCLDRAITLRDLGHSVDIVTYPKGQDINIPGINIIRGGGKWFISKKWRRGPTLYKAVMTICLIPTVVKLLRTGQYDCLHAHEDSAYFCAFLNAISGIPFIYDMHSSLPEQLESFRIKRKLVIKLLRRLESFTIQRADMMMVICRHLYDLVKEQAPEKEVFLAENMPIMTLRKEGTLTSSVTADDLRNEFKLDHQPVVLYTGSLGKNQGIGLLIDCAPIVIKQCKDVLFMIVGGEEAEIEKYSNLVREHGISDNFVFVGSRNPAEMEAFMELSTCLVSPRITGKNTPLKVYSYLQSGKPVVATAIYTHTQVMDSSTAVLTGIDPKSYADGIVWVCCNPIKAKAIGMAGKQLVANEYRRGEYIRQHILMYEALSAKCTKKHVLENA